MPSPFRVVRRTPWFLIAQAGLIANAHWKNLPPGDRERLLALLRKSKGRPANLTDRERDDVRLLLGRLELAGLARELVPFAARGARKRRRGRR